MPFTYNLPAAGVAAALSFTPTIGTSDATPLDDGNATAFLAGALSAATLKTVFKFKTDSLDLDDGTTTEEFTESVTSSNFAFEGDEVVSGAIVNGGNIYSNGDDQTIEFDYVRHLSKELLGHRKADIFSNEADLRGVVTTQDTAWVTAIIGAIEDARQTCIDQLLATLTSTPEGRTTLANNTSEISNTAGVGTFSFPFAEGDSLVIPITFSEISSLAITNSNITDQTVGVRTYNVTFGIVA